MMGEPMKVEITGKNVTGPDGEALAVGSTFVVKGEAVPAWLVNKCRIVSAGKTAVTNPAQGAVQQPVGDQPKTAAEVLAMANDGTHFQTFRSEAHKLLGDATPGSKDEIVLALEALATDPGAGE